MPSVAAVIGNYNGARVLRECVASLRAQTLAPAEIVVVDGASLDESVAIAHELGVRVIETENRGLGHLYNLGARSTDADYVLLVNNDVALDGRCVELLAQALEQDRSRFAADPRQLDGTGRETIHARTVLHRGRLLGAPIPGLTIHPLVEAHEIVPTLTANAGAMLVRRSLLLELGGFDERFFMDYEDLDLCWRAWLRGWASVYVPQAFLRHEVGVATASAPEASPRRLASAHANILRFALKCLPPGPAARVVLGELLRLPRHPRPVGAALVRTARGLPGILRERRQLQPGSDLLARLLLQGRER